MNNSYSTHFCIRIWKIQKLFVCNPIPTWMYEKTWDMKMEHDAVDHQVAANLFGVMLDLCWGFDNNYYFYIFIRGKILIFL